MQKSALCRSRRELSNGCVLATFDFGTAENEPSKVCSRGGSVQGSPIDQGSSRSDLPRARSPARPASLAVADGSIYTPPMRQTLGGSFPAASKQKAPFGCQAPAVDEIDGVLDVTKRSLRGAFLVEPPADHHALLPLPRHVEMFSSRDPGKSPARVCQIGTAKSGVLEPPCNHFAARATLREA